MPKPLERAADLVDAAQQIDHLADAVRTVEGLRARARTALARAAKVGRVRRAFWTWQAHRLAEKADTLARTRGLTP